MEYGLTPLLGKSLWLQASMIFGLAGKRSGGRLTFPIGRRAFLTVQGSWFTIQDIRLSLKGYEVPGGFEQS